MRTLSKNLCVLVAMWAIVQMPVSARSQSLPGALYKPPAIELTRTEQGYEARLWLAPESGVLHLMITPPESSSNAISLGMARRTELWKPLLEQMFSEQGQRAEYVFTVGMYPELPMRLAEAAVRSGNWDLKKGRPFSGDAETGVKALLAQPGMYSELENLFAPFHYKVSVAEVEEASSEQWEKYKATATTGLAETAIVPPKAAVPYGATIVFKLTKTDPQTAQ